MTDEKRTLTPQTLAFYLGGKVFVPETNKVGILIGIDYHKYLTTILNVQYSEEKDDWDVFNENDESITRVKPILRRLEDMTEGDYKDRPRGGIDGINWTTVEAYLESKGGLYLNDFTAKEILWLLSKGFDLFSLIDSGLAIDAKTLKQ